jgi:hypothetical protein
VQAQEVTDLGKVHVINEASGEALAFKRLVIRSVQSLNPVYASFVAHNVLAAHWLSLVMELSFEECATQPAGVKHVVLRQVLRPLPAHCRISMSVTEYTCTHLYVCIVIISF